MPHQCVRCGSLYDDGSEQILKGCTCGAKLFFFIRKEHFDKKNNKKLSKEEVKQIESDVKDIVGVDELDKTIVLDLESINISEAGKYQIDLVHLFKGEPLIYKVEEGKYVIDLASSFQLHKKDRSKSFLK